MSVRFSMLSMLFFVGIIYSALGSKLLRLVIGTVWIFANLFVQFSIMTRRLHDLNWSGFWLLIIIPIYLFSISTVETTRDDGLLAIALAGSLLIFLVLILLYFKKGTKGANKFGSDSLLDKAD